MIVVYFHIIDIDESITDIIILAQVIITLIMSVNYRVTPVE